MGRRLKAFMLYKYVVLIIIYITIVNSANLKVHLRVVAPTFESMVRMVEKEIPPSMAWMVSTPSGTNAEQMT